MLSAGTLGARGEPQTAGQPAGASRHERLSSALNQHFSIVWRTVRRLGVLESASDDAAQQVFIIFADRLEYVAPERERAFLVATACRVAANVRRKHARRREVSDEAFMEHERHPAPDPERLLEMKRWRELLDQLLARLSPDLRTVFVLFELERLSSNEISELLEIPVGTVASRLRRARAAFQAEVEELKSRPAQDGGAR